MRTVLCWAFALGIFSCSTPPHRIHGHWTFDHYDIGYTVTDSALQVKFDSILATMQSMAIDLNTDGTCRSQLTSDQQPVEGTFELAQDQRSIILVNDSTGYSDRVDILELTDSTLVLAIQSGKLHLRKTNQASR